MFYITICKLLIGFHKVLVFGYRLFQIKICFYFKLNVCILKYKVDIFLSMFGIRWHEMWLCTYNFCCYINYISALMCIFYQYNEWMCIWIYIFLIHCNIFLFLVLNFLKLRELILKLENFAGLKKISFCL